MIFESSELINTNVIEEFNWILTRFIIFEIEKSLVTLPESEIKKIERVITFHEKLENFEICHKLLTYKNRI